MIYNSTEFSKPDKPFVGCNAPGDQQLQRLFQTGVINEEALTTKKHPLKLKNSDLAKLKVEQTITRKAHKVEINIWELLSQIHKENPEAKIHLDGAESQKNLYNWKRKSLNDLGLLHCEPPVQPINHITITVPNPKKETEPLLKILNQVRDHIASQLEGKTPVERASLAKKHIFDHYDDVWRPVLILKAHFHTDSGETYQIHIHSDQVESGQGFQIFPSEQKSLTKKKLYQTIFNQATKIFHHADSWPLSVAKITNGERPFATGLEAQLLSDAQYASEEKLVKALIKAFNPKQPYSTFVLNTLFTLSNCQHHFSLQKVFDLMRKEPYPIDDPLYIYLTQQPDKLSEAIPLIQLLALLSADLKKEGFFHTRYQEQRAIQWKRLLIPLNTVSLKGVKLETFEALLPLFPLSKTENLYEGASPHLKRLHFAFYKYPDPKAILKRLQSPDSALVQLLKESVAKKRYILAATLLEALSKVELAKHRKIATEITKRAGSFSRKVSKLKKVSPPSPEKKKVVTPVSTYSLTLRVQETLAKIKAGDLDAIKDLPDLNSCSQRHFNLCVKSLTPLLATKTKKSKKIANIFLNNLNTVIIRTEPQKLGPLLTQLLLFKGDLSFTPPQEEFVAQALFAAEDPKIKMACMAFLGAKRLAELASIKELQKLLLSLPSHEMGLLWTKYLREEKVNFPLEFAYQLFRRCKCSHCISAVVYFFIITENKDQVKQRQLIKILVETKRGKDLSRLVQLYDPIGMNINVVKRLLAEGYVSSAVKVIERNPTMFEDVISELQDAIPKANDNMKRAIEKPMLFLILKQNPKVINQYIFWAKKSWEIVYLALVIEVSLKVVEWNTQTISKDQNLTLFLLFSHPNAFSYNTLLNKIYGDSQNKSIEPFLNALNKIFISIRNFDDAQKLSVVGVISYYFDKLMAALPLDHPGLLELLSRVHAAGLPECNVSAMHHLEKRLKTQPKPKEICQIYSKLFDRLVPLDDCKLMAKLLDRYAIPGIITQEQEAVLWRRALQVGLIGDQKEIKDHRSWIDHIIARFHLTTGTGFQKTLILLILEELKAKNNYNQFLIDFIKIIHKVAEGSEIQIIPKKITTDNLKSFLAQIEINNYAETLDLCESFHIVFSEFIAANFEKNLAVKLFELQSLFIGRFVGDYPTVPSHATRVGALLKQHILGEMPRSYKSFYQKSLTFSSAFISLAESVGLFEDKDYRKKAPSDYYLFKLYTFNRFDQHEIKKWETENALVQEGLLELIINLTTSKYPLPASRALDLYMDLKKCPDFTMDRETEMKIVKSLFYTIMNFGHVVLQTDKKSLAPPAHYDLAFKEEEEEVKANKFEYLDLNMKTHKVHAIYFAQQVHEYIDQFLADKKMTLFQKGAKRVELFKYLHQRLIYSFETSYTSNYSSAKTPLYRQTLVNFLIKITDFQFFPDYKEYLSCVGAVVTALNQLSMEGRLGEYTIEQQIPIASMFRKPKKLRKKELLTRAEIFNEWFTVLASMNKEFATVIYKQWASKYAIFEGFAKAKELEKKALAALGKKL